MPTTLQKRSPAPANDQRASTTPPTTGSNAWHQSQTYAIDIVQTLRVTSDEPLTRRTIDAVKKSLGKLGLGTGDRGCVSDDEGGVGLRVVQTGLEVVRGSGGTNLKSTTPPSPSPPPRPHTASPGGSGKQKKDHAKQAVQQPAKRILFYHVRDPYYGFTNFSPDLVEYRGKQYPTSEHLFQSLKVSEGQWTLTTWADRSVAQGVYVSLEPVRRGWGATPMMHRRDLTLVTPQFLDHRPELAEHIRTCSPRPRVVFDETHRFNPEVRPDWLRVRVDMMDLVLWHKFTQNDHLKQELLSTGEAELVEDSDKDAFWGVGPDGKGENQLGKALQRLRAKLRDEASTKPSQQR
ncbi:hypothetical protein JVT61DRAFT_4212 [Boletus reticuloceps]|uniref:NADAR domain-containing protein n=1 Tax=Boletus reticuloceps TaxID=495285 RepID=A0A8I2YPZ0_9AGAM|nr:hypothetical protein JVT61DRAFT_4212 [Boletus reticuloceps]